MSESPRHFASRLRNPTTIRSFWTITRVSLGFTGITMLLLISAWWLGLLPDRVDTILQERKFLSESLAVTCSGLFQMEKPEQVHPLLVEISHRTPDLLSAGIRDKEGKLIVEIGNHDALWTNRTGQQSTDSQMKVPISLGDAAWGTLELRFVSIDPAGLYGLLHDNIFRLFVFITLGGLVTYGGYIWRIMRSVMVATSSGAIPNRIRASLNTLAEGVLILDKQKRIVLANEAFAHSLGRLSKDVEGNVVSSLPWIRPENQGTIPYPWDQAAITGEPSTGVILGLQGKGQRAETVSINSTPIMGVDGSFRGVMVTLDNLTKIEEKNEHLRQLTDQLQQSQTEIMEQNQKLEFLATRDPLTGCLNRRAFFAQMEIQLATTRRYGYPFCCIMLDIDHFKAVNDTHGHAVGDQVIQHVAKMMEACKRTSDLVARFGGEEFVLLLPHVEIGGAVEVAERLRRTVDETPCGDVHYTVSLGVTEVDQEAVKSGDHDANALLNQADEALYTAKRTGRNRVCRWDKLPGGQRGADLQQQYPLVR